MEEAEQNENAIDNDDDDELSSSIELALRLARYAQR